MMRSFMRSLWILAVDNRISHLSVTFDAELDREHTFCSVRKMVTERRNRIDSAGSLGVVLICTKVDVRLARMLVKSGENEALHTIKTTLVRSETHTTDALKLRPDACPHFADCLAENCNVRIGHLTGGRVSQLNRDWKAKAQS